LFFGRFLFPDGFISLGRSTARFLFALETIFDIGIEIIERLESVFGGVLVVKFAVRLFVFTANLRSFGLDTASIILGQVPAFGIDVKKPISFLHVNGDVFVTYLPSDILEIGPAAGRIYLEHHISATFRRAHCAVVGAVEVRHIKKLLLIFSNQE
jgi:hypothetical protein